MGAKRQFVEKLITYYLKPTSNEHINFNDILITQTEEIDKFIPQKNEIKWRKKKISKKNLILIQHICLHKKILMVNVLIYLL